MDINVDRGVLGGRIEIHWWAIVIRGVAAVLFGLLALIWPAISLIALVTLFGVYVIVDGLFAIIAALRTAEERGRWWPLLLLGLLGIAAGVVTFSYPGITTLILLYIVGSWAILIGIMQILASTARRNDVGAVWLWVLSGVLSVLFGILLFAYPVIGVLAVAWMIGFYALFYGFTLIALGFQLRGSGQPLRTALQH